MALLPLEAMFKGDFVVLLVPVDDQDTMDVVAQKVAHHTINRRVAPKDAPISVRYKGAVVPKEKTVAEVGIGPMEFVEAFYDE